LKTEVEIAIIESLKNYQEFSWKPIEKGYTNQKFLISGKKSTPIAVCKIYTENEIYKPELRFEREKHSLEQFGGDIAPKLLWSSKTGILVYEYVNGQELHLTDYNKLNPSLIINIIRKVHEEARKIRKPIKEDVLKYYSQIIDLVSSSEDDYPTKLVEKLKVLKNKLGYILDENSDLLTHIHGDLVPPNFIVNKKEIKLLDWEFSRAELPYFDVQYFNYYAKAHSIPIQLEVPKKLETFYDDLVDVLEKIWRHGYLKKNKQLFYDIEDP
jgi:thiamine kinase-like enzyme